MGEVVEEAGGVGPADVRALNAADAVGWLRALARGASLVGGFGGLSAGMARDMLVGCMRLLMRETRLHPAGFDCHGCLP